MYQKLEDETLIIGTVPKNDPVETEPLTLEPNYMYDVVGESLIIQTENRQQTDYIRPNQGYYTAEDIIGIFDEECRNQIPMKTKMRWLEEIERLIQKEVIDTHVVPPGYDTRSHFVDFGPKTQMYAYVPYHVVYGFYLRMRRAQVENDTKILNTMTTLYNNAVLTFQQEYNRNNKRKAVSSPYYNHALGGY